MHRDTSTSRDKAAGQVVERTQTWAARPRNRKPAERSCGSDGHRNQVSLWSTVRVRRIISHVLSWWLTVGQDGFPAPSARRIRSGSWDAAARITCRTRLAGELALKLPRAAVIRGEIRRPILGRRMRVFNWFERIREAAGARRRSELFGAGLVQHSSGVIG
jgi:hypothetical protein